MSAGIATALITAGVSLILSVVTALLAHTTRVKGDARIALLQSQLTDERAGRNAQRDYEYDARKRLFGNRPTDRLSRRLMTNILVDVASATSATATSYLTTYRVDGYTDGTLAPRPPTNVGHYEDAFRNIDGTWLLATPRVFLPFGTDTERLSPQSAAPEPDNASGTPTT